MLYLLVIAFLCKNILVKSEDLSFVHVNGDPLQITSTTKGEPYHYFSTYYFLDGELAKFTFYNNHGPKATKFIGITSKAFEINTNHIKVEEHKYVFLYIKLTKQNDGGYIEFQLRQENNKSYFTRIYLSLAKMKPAIEFRINDIIAPSVECFGQSKNDNASCFVFENYDTENVTIKSFIDDSVYVKLTCSTKYPDSLINLNSGYSTELGSSILYVECNVYDLNGVSKKIELKSQSNKAMSSFIPTIIGLTMSRTLAMYRRDDNTLSILYNYEGLEQLNLSCVTKRGKVKWEFNHTHFAYNYTSSIGIRPGDMMQGVFILNNSEKRAVITCSLEYKKNSVEITIVRGNLPTFVSTSENTITTSTTISNSQNVISVTDQFHETIEPASTIKKEAIIGASVGALVFVFIVVIGFIIKRNLKKLSNTSLETSNVNYQNLPDDINRNMPIPKQYQEPAYAIPTDTLRDSIYVEPFRPTLEEMYTKPISKHERTKQIGKTNKTVDDITPTYAKTVPKNQRQSKINKDFTDKKNMPRPDDVNENAYAYISFENPYVELDYSQTSSEKFEKIAISPYTEIIDIRNLKTAEFHKLYSQTSSEKFEKIAISPYTEIIDIRNLKTAEFHKLENPYTEISCNESLYSENGNKRESPYTEIIDNKSPYSELDDNDTYTEANQASIEEGTYVEVANNKSP